MGLGRLSYPNESHLKKKKKKKIKPNDRIGRIPYDLMQSYTILYTILPFLRSCYDFKLFGEVGSILQFYDPDCDFDNNGGAYSLKWSLFCLQ